MTEFAKELWVVEETMVHYHFTEGVSPNHKCGSRLNLVCYNRLTKELLHTYGPFTDAEELFQWAKEHGIQLGEDLPECDHNPWVTRSEFNKWIKSLTERKPFWKVFSK